MHLHCKSTQIQLLSGVKVLLILLISYTSCASADLSQDEITQVMNDVAPERFCGRKLTEAMRIYCLPAMRSLIQRQNPVKKSLDSNPDFDFESFDLDRMASELYDEERSSARYKIDESYVNDIPYLFPSQGRRRRRGIIDECCKKPCRKTDLITFCPKKQY